MSRKVWVAAAAVAVVAVGALLWWQREAPAPAQPVELPAPAPVVAAPASTPAPVPAPAILHPIEPPAVAEPAAPADISTALIDLFGRKAVLSMFQVDGFARRLCDRRQPGPRHAPSRLWPVNTSSGRFIVEHRDGSDIVGADNGLRYTPFVLLIETVDMRQAVATYVRMYPLFQQAYEDLGYPKRYFNDRLVEVIDLLLATPEVDGPLKVHLPQINGPVQPERPWVLYEFDDPALQSLSAGQKILLRIGPVNERRMKAKLEEIRRLVTASAPAR